MKEGGGGGCLTISQNRLVSWSYSSDRSKKSHMAQGTS